MTADDAGAASAPLGDAPPDSEAPPDIAGDGSPVVEARDLALAFGDVTVLDGVSLSVQPGDLVAVVGPNGSGKTTLLEVLSGLSRPDSGAVERRPTSGRSVAYLPQRPDFRPGLTVEQTLRFYGGLVEGPVDVEASLERVGLLDARERRVEALSGGMVRLLGFAQALVGNPPFVVLDEPSSGLDPNLADQMFHLAEGLARDGRGVLLASHDLAAVEETADEVCLLADGVFRARGSPSEVVASADDATSLRAAFRSLVGHPAGRDVERDDGKSEEQADDESPVESPDADPVERGGDSR